MYLYKYSSTECAPIYLISGKGFLRRDDDNDDGEKEAMNLFLHIYMYIYTYIHTYYTVIVFVRKHVYAQQ